LDLADLERMDLVAVCILQTKNAAVAVSRELDAGELVCVDPIFAPLNPVDTRCGPVIPDAPEQQQGTSDDDDPHDPPVDPAEISVDDGEVHDQDSRYQQCADVLIADGGLEPFESGAEVVRCIWRLTWSAAAWCGCRAVVTARRPGGPRRSCSST